MTSDKTSALCKLADSLENCSRLIDSAALDVKGVLRSGNERRPASLLERCEELTSGVAANLEPIRTIHHFACTGGTLISKCLASIPNSLLLSEVYPFSGLNNGSASHFHPTDLIQLYRSSSWDRDVGIEGEIFLSGVEVLYRHCVRAGRRLMLRDHSHSKYCLDSSVAGEPSLRELLNGQFSLLSVLTVRHPLDSYLSLRVQEWLHFSPATLDEYCRRYIAFLDDHAGIKILKYEDFVAAPLCRMQEICDVLALPLNPEFVNLFHVQSMSGDSGRTSSGISRRGRREVNEDVKQQLGKSNHYKLLCTRLKYDPGVGDFQ